MALNVLIVDDSSVMRAMIRKTLNISGLPVAQVYEASNGAEGLEILDEQNVDLCLVDLNMPVMDGEEMIERLRREPDFIHLPVLVVSTEGSFTRISLLRQKGAEFVHKPFTPEALREAVSELTGVTHASGTGPGAVPGGSPDF
jgi:two-component system chemotaxis response regulator CheY